MGGITTFEIIEVMREYPEGINALDLYEEFPQSAKRIDDFFKELAELQRKNLIFNNDTMWVVTATGNKYYDKLSNEVATEMRHDELRYSKLMHETKIAKLMSTTYWWTFGIAIAALIISIISLFIKLYF